MSQRSVLRLSAAEETTRYRNAVAEILQRILTEKSEPDKAYTLVEIAETIDVSLGTISNAANKRADLSPTYLNRLGVHYGAHVLEPFARLSGGRIVPLWPDSKADVLPFVMRVASSIAEARDPQSPGGERETHKERFDMLPRLHDLQRELGALVAEIEREREGLAA